MSSVTDTSVLTEPGRSSGLTSVFQRRYLLNLIVRKEITIRYRGSILGWLWSYAKPLIQFFVFWAAIGYFLGMNDRVEFFPIYLLSGITVVTFFNEAFANGTRSLVDNAALIKKIYLPREMFPVSSMLIAAVNSLPQILVILGISLFFGWTPTLGHLGALLAALILIAVLATGLGLLFGAINVTFRDAQSFVEIITMISVWASPVMYQWQMVQEKVPEWLFLIYRLNPITIAVELFHYGIWFPLGPANAQPLPDLWLFAGIAMAMSLVILAIGQLVFRRLEGRFAQDL